MMNLKSVKKLNNGVEMPVIGLGVYGARKGEETINAIKQAVETGYRMIDTAAAYKNESDVGIGIKETGIARSDIFITTKMWNGDQKAHNQRAGFEESLTKLGVDYVDLYLMHWPIHEVYPESWKVMEKLYDEKLARAIGVSNFHAQHLDYLFMNADVIPAVNQIELHPYLTQKPLIEICERHNIAVEGWRPLGGGKNDLLVNETIAEIAKKHKKTTAQVILKWNLQLGIIIIPKTVHKERIKENSEIFDFDLTEDELKTIDALNKYMRIGSNPDEWWTFV